MATTTQAKPIPAAPAARRVRLTLAIEGTAYAVRPVQREAMPEGAIRAFTLSRSDHRLGRVVHRIAENFDGLVCSCGDQTYRQTPTGGQCKHLAAVVACGLF